MAVVRCACISKTRINLTIFLFKSKFLFKSLILLTYWAIIVTIIIIIFVSAFCYFFYMFCFLLLFLIFIVLWCQDIINLIASIVIFINFLISFSLLFFLFIIIIISFIVVIIIIIIILVMFFFFLLLVKQLFSHETVKVSRLFVYLFVLFLWGNNTKFHYFFPVRKRFTIFFIYFHLNIILNFILNFTFFLPLVLLWIYFNRFYSSY